MPGGGSGYYPGVDPDNRTPGGIEVAGNVDAATFSQGGEPLTADGLSKACVLYNGNSVTVPHGDTINAPYDTIVHDPSSIADIAGNGVKVTESGLYVVSIETAFEMAASNTGNGALLPNSLGPTTFRGGRQYNVAITDRGIKEYIWFLYLGVTTPDTIFIEVDNNSNVDGTIGGSVLSVARLG